MRFQMVQRYFGVSLVLFAGLIGLIVSLYPSFRSGFRNIPAHPADVRFNNYLLEHSWGWLTRQPIHQSFWSPPFYFPARYSLSYSDLMIGFAPAYWPWRALGMNFDDAYLAWLITVMLGSYAAAFAFLRLGLSCSSLGATFGAYVIAYGISHTHQLSHPQLIPWAFILAAFLSVWKYFSPSPDPAMTTSKPLLGHRGWIILFFSSMTAQFYGGFYMGFFTVLVLIVAFLWCLVFSRCRTLLWHACRRDGLWLFACAGLSAFALLPVARHYWWAQTMGGTRPWVQVESCLPRLQSWITPSFQSCWYKWVHALSIMPARRPGEDAVGFGFVTTLAALTGLFIGRRPAGLVLMGLTCITLIGLATLYPSGMTPWYYVYQWLPGAGAIRAVGRLGMLLIIPGGLGLALLIDRARHGLIRAAVVVLAIVCCIEQAGMPMSFDKYEMRDYVNHLAQSVDPRQKAFIACTKDADCLDEQIWELQLDAMFAASLTGISTLNGYSGGSPTRWHEFFLLPRVGTPEQQRELKDGIYTWSKLYHIVGSRIQLVETEKFRAPR